MERFVLLRKIRAPQSVVYKRRLTEHILRKRVHIPGKHLPLVYEFDDVFYVKNGNHRISASLLKKRKKMKMRVVTCPRA